MSYLLPLLLMALGEPEQLQLELIVGEPSPRKGGSRNETASQPGEQPRLRPPVASGRPLPLPQPSSFAGLLTTQETAAFLGVHPRTVQRLVERGQLSAVHLGTAVRFDPVDVAELTTRLKHRGATPPASTEIVSRGRSSRASFADRLRSQQHEHRAAQA